MEPKIIRSGNTSIKLSITRLMPNEWVGFAGNVLRLGVTSWLSLQSRDERSWRRSLRAAALHGPFRILGLLQGQGCER